MIPAAFRRPWRRRAGVASGSFSMIVSTTPRARVLDRIEPIVEKHGADAAAAVFVVFLVRRGLLSGAPTQYKSWG
jgi:hypothetical protein